MRTSATLPFPEWHGWHACRRGLGSNLYRLGVPDVLIQRILRHANVSTTTGYYIKTAADDVREAMTKLERNIPQTPLDTNWTPEKPSIRSKKDGGPGQSRTADQRFRKPLLYPSELRGRSEVISLSHINLRSRAEREARIRFDSPSGRFAGGFFDVRLIDRGGYGTIANTSYLTATQNGL